MEPQRLMMPNGWYDPVWEREQRRHPFVQIWESQQRLEQAERQAIEDAHRAERVAREAVALARKIAADAQAFADYGLTVERIRQLIACQGVDVMAPPANQQDVEVLHEWIVSLHEGGVSLRKVGEQYGIGPDHLRRWMVLAEQSLADLKAAKEAAVIEKRRERVAYRFKNGYADKHGRTYPHVAEAFTDEYLAGGVTLKALADKYCLSATRIRQLIARVQKKRGWKRTLVFTDGR